MKSNLKHARKIKASKKQIEQKTKTKFRMNLEKNENFHQQSLDADNIISNTGSNNNVFHSEIIQDIIHNEKIPPKHRNFSEQTLSFSYDISSISPVCYDVIRQSLPLPSRETLRIQYGQELKAIKDELFNIQKINEIVRRYRKALEIDSQIFFHSILAVDAV
ncbi:hypothetical protein TRFO_25223 [Tritrichomonas foetus]|uniref:Uncharacterized protein n=1 Tax=Tritrichomonas foetus TaxID=1144522 RepID=A0A1J4K703_9EUKA|nr:hypothetical protein TRFO_25223 [Tritrichomonas foetus]|eukprot:OHT06680.1 hypothetical protein TRFO_25223 [Tritrichomonas foetus]